MKKVLIGISVILIIAVLALTSCSCLQSSSDIQSASQEAMLKAGVQQVGMPNIVNFREMKLYKDIYELRDQDNLTTYTYLENMVPTIVPGNTVLGGKLTFVGNSIGFGIPYATEFTAPEKPYGTYYSIPQADPNGLYTPSSAAGTWVLMANPNGGDAQPVYLEPNVVVSPFEYPFDK